jgi:predicted transcriptional regulator
MKSKIFGLDPQLNFSLAFLMEGSSSWLPITTIEKDQKDSSGTYLESILTNLEGDTEYYLTLYEIQEEIEPPERNILGIMLTISVPVVCLIIGIIIIISKEEYLDFIKTKINNLNTGVHRLTLKEVLDNKNRNTIIEMILENPGIHFNELLRKTNLSPGNLVWHLDILDAYKIIGKKRLENYIVYFPLYQKNPLSNLDLKLKKSDLTLRVLEMIKNEPGIWNNKITKKLEIHRKTIQYHIKKLMKLELIFTVKDGSKKKIYLNTESEYFNNNS